MFTFFYLYFLVEASYFIPWLNYHWYDKYTTFHTNIHSVFCMPDSTNDSVLEEMKKAYMVEQESKEMKQ